MSITVPGAIRRRTPDRVRDFVRREKLRRSRVPGPPSGMDLTALTAVAGEILEESPVGFLHANVSGYKEGNAWVVWARGEHRAGRLVCKDSDLRADAYPAIVGFPGKIGLPEARIYESAPESLQGLLPRLYRRLELV